MEKVGIIREIDGLGRIVLPAQYRRSLKLSIGDSVELNLENGGISVKKVSTSCCLCGSNKDLTKFKGEDICSACLDELRNVQR